MATFSKSSEKEFMDELTLPGKKDAKTLLSDLARNPGTTVSYEEFTAAAIVMLSSGLSGYSKKDGDLYT
jgi:hypothetical protein